MFCLLRGCENTRLPLKLNRKIIMELEKRYYAPKGIIMEDMHIEMIETFLIMCFLLTLMMA